MSESSVQQPDSSGYLTVLIAECRQRADKTCIIVVIGEVDSFTEALPPHPEEILRAMFRMDIMGGTGFVPSVIRTSVISGGPS